MTLTPFRSLYSPMLIAFTALLLGCATNTTLPLTGKYIGYSDAKLKDFGSGIKNGIIAGGAAGGVAFGPFGAVLGAAAGTASGLVAGTINMFSIPCGVGSVDITFESIEGEQLTANAEKISVCHLKPGDPITYFKVGDSVMISAKQQNIQQTYTSKDTKTTPVSAK
ncbi:hypothetical protein [Aquitalea magnusonii]|uniref:hypothetical protein n=1 Tax=Aquitalea magnusonii TaxID=332411 RepID=UPI0011B45563|nr:hypothetical protein [Aquitalea magnusonii]